MQPRAKSNNVKQKIRTLQLGDGKGKRNGGKKGVYTKNSVMMVSQTNFYTNQRPKNKNNNRKVKDRQAQPNKKSVSCHISNKNSHLKYRKASGDICDPRPKNQTVQSGSEGSNFKNSKISEHLKQNNKKRNKHPIMVTEYTEEKPKNNKFTRTMTNLKARLKSTEHKGQNKKVLMSPKVCWYPIDQNYRTDVIEVLEKIGSQQDQQLERVKIVGKKNREYLLKRSKDKFIKAAYTRELEVYIQLGLYPATNSKYPHHILKLSKYYQYKKYLYLLYEYGGVSLNLQNKIHQQIISKVLNNNGMVLKYMIKQIAKGLNELSRRGFTHGNIHLSSLIVNICQKPTTISLEGNIKLTNLQKAFHISEKKQRLSHYTHSLYTPPEIINYMIFEENNKILFDDGSPFINSMDNRESFDRELIEYIGYYDEPWYPDVWGLGIMILELVAGQSIDIQKSMFSERVSSPVPSCSILGQSEIPVQQSSLIKLKGFIRRNDGNKSINFQDQNETINLSDILNAQKKILEQTAQQLDKLSFDENLQSLVVRMLSTNPFLRPSPKQIIAFL